MDIRSALAVAVLVTGSVAVSAQGAPRPEKNPYRNLFADAVSAWQPAVTPKAPTPQKPVVVCAMRIIPADPDVDPKIRVAPPTGVEHSMRRVTPSVCQPK